MTRWCLGAIVGTLLVAATSPLFVRTYQSLSFDTVRGTWTLRPGTQYRWRSEGYATTVIGPHGMPGRIDLPSTNSSRISALWGDSQAEGVGVNDDRKLWAAMQKNLPDTEVLPFARSGEDARVWTSQMKRVEADLGVTDHTLLIAELSDLSVLADFKTPATDDSDGALNSSNASTSSDTDPQHTDPQQTEPQSHDPANGHRRARSDSIPDFIVHAIVGILGGTHPSQFRDLRFGLGPITEKKANAGEALSKSESNQSKENTWKAVLTNLARASDSPIRIVYAPRIPLVIGDQIRTKDPDNDNLALLQSHLAEGQYPNISLVDCRDSLLRASQPYQFPHGFHHGVIGSGHLNAHGYETIADAIAKSNSKGSNDQPKSQVSGP